MAKTSAKKSFAGGKSNAAVSAKANPKKSTGLAVKSAVRPVKTPAKPIAKGATRLVAKSVARSAKKTSNKPAPIQARVTAPAKPLPPAKSAKSAKSHDTPGSNGNGERHMKRPPLTPAPMPIPVAHSANNGRPKKNLAGLTSRELDHFRDLLLAKRRELIGDMSSMEREALRSGGGSNLSNLPIHMADMGTDNYEQEFTLGLVQKERDLLKEINLALAKIQNGNYGVCEGTGLPIIKERLEYQPWARYSVEHQRKLERHLR